VGTFLRHSVDNGSQPSLNRSPRNFHTSLMWVKPENLPAKIFAPPLKIWREKPEISPNFRLPAVNRKRVISKRLNLWTNKNQMFHLR